MRTANAALGLSSHGFGTMIGLSPAMEQVFSLARKIAASNATTILITGETGTGKDLLARELHFNSGRRAEPFIEVNCSAIPETLLETELFGYEQGAFTDAKGLRRGLFELASGGTLFLDEIGYMTANLQVKLLKAIEEKRIRRVGGTRDIEADIRIMAATNRNLELAMRKGIFRENSRRFEPTRWGFWPNARR
ncbi:MAG: sigma-54 factor interaction domain-containing protein, partial [Candidatus Eisenbacteria bacterium]|nr:sigma-54 factor interaction domain-containing protein [Candidatus Eisenbacteria bacterium]